MESVNSTFQQIVGKGANLHGSYDKLEAVSILQLAANIIGSHFKRYQMRRIFKDLKSSIYKAEQFMSSEVIHRLVPAEAILIKDPLIHARVRFRFGGTNFPPKIYFKVFTSGGKVTYYCGKYMIAPGTEAAKDACKMMGPRVFTQGVLMDDYERELYKMTDMCDITNPLDYIQFASSMDTRPVHLGGRNNNWRELPIPLSAFHNLWRDITTNINDLTKKDQEILEDKMMQLFGQPQVPQRKVKLKKGKTDAERKKEKINQLRTMYGFPEMGFPSNAQPEVTSAAQPSEGHPDQAPPEVGSASPQPRLGTTTTFTPTAYPMTPGTTDLPPARSQQTESAATLEIAALTPSTTVDNNKVDSSSLLPIGTSKATLPMLPGSKRSSEAPENSSTTSHSQQTTTTLPSSSYSGKASGTQPISSTTEGLSELDEKVADELITWSEGLSPESIIKEELL